MNKKRFVLTLGLAGLVLGGIFLVDLIEKSHLEYVNTEEALFRYTISCQDLRTDSATYGGFVYNTRAAGMPGHRAHLDDTYQAVSLLHQLGALHRIDASPIVAFLNTSTQLDVTATSGYWSADFSAIYDALRILDAIGIAEMAPSLINFTSLRQVILLQPSQQYASLVFLADHLEWIDHLNSTWYAEQLYFRIRHYLYPSSGYAPSTTLFYQISRDIRALSVLDGAASVVPDPMEFTEFNDALTDFLLMRWDGYNGGFDSHPWGSLSSGTSYPQTITAQLRATYEGILTAKTIGLNLVDALMSQQEWLTSAFERLVSRCQTTYGFYVDNPNAANCLSNKPWDSEIEHNFYAVSILNLSNSTESLEKGVFRWPPGTVTVVESLGWLLLIPVIGGILVPIGILTTKFLPAWLHKPSR